MSLVIPVSNWTCGHKADAACAECYRELARVLSDLADLHDHLKEENAKLRYRLASQEIAWDTPPWVLAYAIDHGSSRTVE
jgi:hypothetical protein